MAKQKSSGWLDKYDEGGTVGQFLRGLVTPETKRSDARAAISTAPRQQSYTSKAWDAVTHPVTAFKHLVNEGRLPNNFAAAAPLGIDTALDVTGLNPFGWADMGVQAFNAGKKMVDGNADIVDLVSMPLYALGMAPGMKTIDKTLTKTAEAAKNNKKLNETVYKLAQKYPQVPNLISNVIPQTTSSVKDLKKNTVNKVVGSILDNPNVSNKVKEAVKSTKSGFVYALSKDDPRLYSTAKNALGKEITVASHRELKDAFEESLDKLKYKPDTIIDPFASQDYEKALGLDVRMKFADRMKMFTDPDYANTIAGNFGDLRSSKSMEFLKNSGFDIDKLNPKERALMDAYAHGYDQYINSRVGKSYNKEFVDYYKNLSDEFNTAVQKNKFNNEGMLNRTTGNYSVNLFDPSTNQTIGTKYRNELSVGDVFKDDSFLSTSLPHSFYNDGNIERIVVPSGGKQSYMFPNSVRSSPFANEEEVILPKGLIRRVEDAIPSGPRNEIVTSILNPYKNGGWLDKYNDGGPIQENYNDASVSYPDNFVGEGTINGPNWKSPAWGGQFEDGGQLPQFQPGGKVITKREDFTPWWNWASRQAGDLGNRQDSYGKVGDLYAYYAGQPLHYNVLEYSQYKPTNSKDPNAKYVSINDPKFRQEIFDQYQNTFVKGDLKSGYPKKINDNTYAISGYAPHDKGLVERAKKLNVRGLDLMRKEHTTSAIGHYYLSKGKDDKGEYISYYDVFDQGTGPNGGGVGETLGLTKPFEIYDRIYLDPKTGKPKMAMGGSMPGAVGFTYARTINPAPSNGPYAKKTKASAQDGITLDSVYSKWPALKNMGPSAITPNTNLGNGLGYGGIEFMHPDLPEVNYDNGTLVNPTPGKNSIIYNPNTEDEQNIRLDMLHGMHQDPKFNQYREQFKKSVLGDPELNADINYWYNIDKQKGRAEDGLDQYTNNYIDGQMRTLLYEGDRKLHNYSDEEANDLHDREDVRRNIHKMQNYLESGDQDKIHTGARPEFLTNLHKLPLPKPKYQNGGNMSYYQNGLDFKPKSISKNGKKIIKDDMGQWAHPGEITEIGSNQITMQGVPYPVLGISDTGDTQMMYPNQDYIYRGSSVTEYPMMAQGGQLTKLDQLTNFTNYNTKQPGGWLDKYQD